MLAAYLLVGFSVINLLKGLMMFFFVLAAILLIAIVLLQEPKGGGLASAFGGAGAETFGVQTGGVNKATSTIAGVFMFLALLYAAIRPTTTERSVMEAPTPAVEKPAEEGGTGGGTPPPEEPGGR